MPKTIVAHLAGFRPTIVDGVPAPVRTNDEITTDEMWEDDLVICEGGKASFADWGELRVGDSRIPDISENWTVKVMEGEQ